MSSTTKTTYLQLSQFADAAEDKPSWRGDYTSDMQKIDKAYNQLGNQAQQAENTATAAQTKVDGFDDRITAVEQGVTEAKASASNASAQVAAMQIDVTTSKTELANLGVTSPESATGLKNKIDDLQNSVGNYDTYFNGLHINSASDASELYDKIANAGTGGGGLTRVTHDLTLTGDGTTGSPLGVSSNYVTADQLSNYTTGFEVNSIINNKLTNYPTTSEMHSYVDDVVSGGGSGGTNPPDKPWTSEAGGAYNWCCKNGVVFIQVGANQTKSFTLPAQYRPSLQLTALAFAKSSGSSGIPGSDGYEPGQIVVKTTGQVSVAYAYSATNSDLQGSICYPVV